MRSHSKAFFAVAAALLAFLALAPVAQAAPKKVVDFFGTPVRGTGGGEFTSATDLAVNQSSGDVYVVDAAVVGNQGQRIQQFTEDGEFIRTWGWGVDSGADAFEICTTSCHEGIEGSGDGQFSISVNSVDDLTTQIAIDQSDGSVYVADTGNDRVQKFSATGAYLAQFGTSGSGAGGELSRPQGVAVDPVTGDVYVSDTSNNRIQRFDSDGNFISAFGLDVVQPGGTGESFDPVNERQSFSLQGELTFPCFCFPPPTGGTFNLSFEGQTTSDIAFDASAATVDTALETLSSVGAGNVDVTGADGGPWEVEFSGSLAATDVPQLTGDGTNLTPAGASVNAQTTEQGGKFPKVETCTVAAECQAGTGGSGPGEFNRPQQLEVDSTGRLYVLDRNNGRIQRFSSTGTFEEVFADGQVSPVQLTLDPADDHVYVGNQSGEFQSGISEFDPSGAFVELHAAEVEAVFEGLAIRSSSGDIYAAGGFGIEEDATPKGFGVAILNEVADPTVSIEPVTDIGGNEATFHGLVNPQGGPPATRYRFEYSTDGVSWTRLPAPEIGEGSADVAVSQTPTHLEALTEYRVRLVAFKAFDAGSATSGELTFSTTGAPPMIEALWPGPVTATTAWLGGRINPQNSTSTYYLEYSTDPSFANGTSVPASKDTPAGSGKSFVLAADQVEGLQPGTTYHYRLVAGNAAGTTLGESRSFRTLADVPSKGLPDGRVWEKVSPAFKGGAGINSTSLSENIFGYRAQAAVDGGAVAYGSNGKFGGDGGSPGSQYLARRGPAGWSTEGINPRIKPAAQTGEGWNLYEWFSDDLRYGLIRSRTPLTPGDPVESLNLYRRDNQTGALERVTPEAPSPALFYFKGAVGDGSHVVVTESNFFDEKSTRRTRERLPNGDVRTLPENAWLGAAAGGGFGAIPDGTTIGANAISADGSRIFYHTSSGKNENGDLFRVEDGQATEHVSASERSGGNPGKPTTAIFSGASTDGSVAYFTSREPLTDASSLASDCDEPLPSLDPNGDGAGCETLYRWDGEAPTGERLTDITNQDPQGVYVLGVTAISDDGDSVYFVAAGDLTGSGNRASGLYLWREGEGVRLIARVSRAVGQFSRDAGELWARIIAGGGYREARVTPDGRYLAFSSRDSLTAYETNGTAQIYLFDSETGRTTCMSCGSVEAESTQGSWFLSCIGVNAGQGEASYCQGPVGGPTEYLVRNLSADGKRFVFDSKDALVPGDTNGAIDVYQWQQGELHLLSSGTNAFPSKLMDASASGDDVFFTTTQQLTRSDTDDLRDLYDARVGGVPEPDVTPPCVADECQGTPKPPPTFQTPASSGTRGAGNLQHGRPRCAKGKVRRKGRCVRKVRKAKKTNQTRRASR